MIIDDLRHSLDLRLDDSQAPASIIAERFLGQKFGVSQNGVQGGAQLMRNRPGNPAQRCEGLDPLDFTLEPPQFAIALRQFGRPCFDALLERMNLLSYEREYRKRVARR